MLVYELIGVKDHSQWQLIEPVVESMGYEFVGVTTRQSGSHVTLVVYIDTEGGVNVDDCARVSTQLSGVIEVEAPAMAEYDLEVSSPGLARPLFRERDFIKFSGRLVRLKLSIPFEGRRNFKGVLVGICDRQVVILVDQHEYFLPCEQIHSAHLLPEFEKSAKQD